MIARYMQRLKETSTPNIAELSAEIKQTICGLVFPPDFETELKEVLQVMGQGSILTVRSSATAEDLPDASFAGQQDTFLNVHGYDNLKSAITSCFASLYNERAIAYRIKNQFDENDISMAVILQRMIPSKVSGVMFTADPMSSDRYTVVVEAVEGLGEDLVSGRKTPVTWYIKNGELRRDGKNAPPLDEPLIKALVQIGKNIESVCDRPQDIEWCYLDGQFHIVQARPITTLYPAPENHDGFKRCYMSFAHMQMMTDVMLPLGTSFSRLLADFALKEAGGRLYIDITHDIKGFYGRKMVFQKAANLDPLMESALKDVVGRKEYLKSIPNGKGSFGTAAFLAPILKSAYNIYRRGTVQDIKVYLERQHESLAVIKSRLEPLHGDAALDVIEKDQKVLYDGVAFDPLGFGMIMAAQFVQGAINKAGEELLGEKNIINRLSLSVDHNITSQMGLALGKIADLIRRSPEAAVKVEQTLSMDCIDEKDIAAAWDEFLGLYGMRCPGEIDITKARFWEAPGQLLPALVNNIKYLADNHAETLFGQGRKQSLDLADKLIQAMRKKHGHKKAQKLQHKINIFRTFTGVREYPIYFWIARYDIYKRSILHEIQKLADTGVIMQLEDAYYLYFEELREAVRTGKADKELIAARKKEYTAYKTLTPPRVIFSDGEVPGGNYNKQVPESALAGIGVSSGIVEGRARVVENMEDANIEKGDILITKFTDPSWTPVFVSIAGLVTEVGGMMTHGAVITREYGLPAVVGVVNATKLIQDGDYIRIDGNDGYIEVLS
jgi:pyruvate,water dikinase